MRRQLSIDRSPALAVPLRFFINVPLFALLAAGVLLWAGPDAFASRWSPASLALTHLFTLGILASAMVGALIQILPVATGVRVAGERTCSAVVHALLTAGTLTLSAAFFAHLRVLYAFAALLLGAAFLWLLAACATGFWRSRRNIGKGAEDVLGATRLALVALLVTVALGAMLAGMQVWPAPLQVIMLIDLHATWGLAGWIGLLIIGMAYQLVPMFLVTELYPRALTRALAPTVFVLLLLISAGVAWSDMLLLAAYALFAVTTLRLLWKRKRPAADATTLFWRTAMLSLACCASIWVVQIATGAPTGAVTRGVLMLFGVAWSAVNGMFYKIIPFLLWYHAQKSLTGAAMRFAPKVKDMISGRAATSQFRAHLAALVLLVLASLWPAAFARVAALAAAISAAWLGINMAAAIGIYLHVKRSAASIMPDTRALNDRRQE
jgi:hypothetical protein